MEQRKTLGPDAANLSIFLQTIKGNMSTSRNIVLIVDDEKAIRMNVVRDVKKFDPDALIFEAGNGLEALDHVLAIRKKYFKDPLLIVLDLNMPVMDGWEVINRLKRDYEEKGRAAGIPIIVLSSTSGEKGGFLSGKKSVHDGKSGYSPLVSIAKESCIDRSRYDSAGEKGLLAWLKFFMDSK